MAIYPGCPYPLGALVEPEGVNFSVFSKHATRVDLLLFDEPDGSPTQIIELDPALPFSLPAATSQPVRLNIG